MWGSARLCVGTDTFYIIHYSSQQSSLKFRCQSSSIRWRHTIVYFIFTFTVSDQHHTATVRHCSGVLLDVCQLACSESIQNRIPGNWQSTTTVETQQPPAHIWLQHCNCSCSSCTQPRSHIWQSPLIGQPDNRTITILFLSHSWSKANPQYSGLQNCLNNRYCTSPF